MKIKREVRIGYVPNEWLISLLLVSGRIAKRFIRKKVSASGNKKIMLTGIIGCVFAVIFAVLLLVPIRGLDCSLGKESYVCLIVWTIIGIFFYRICNVKKNDR